MRGSPFGRASGHGCPGGVGPKLRAWIFVGLAVVTLGINVTLICLRNPGLLRERLKWPRRTRTFDKVFATIYCGAWLRMLVVPGLDAVRFQWSSLRPHWVYMGVPLHALGAIPVAWVMTTNPFLETTVRIQEEREHRVIQTGPYHFVRHPQYLGLIVMASGWPLVLGSLWTCVPFALLALALVFRTACEGRTLHEELPGYKDYCRQTRYRLLSGAW